MVMVALRAYMAQSFRRRTRVVSSDVDNRCLMMTVMAASRHNLVKIENIFT